MFEVEVDAAQPSRPIGHFLSAVALFCTVLHNFTVVQLCSVAQLHSPRLLHSLLHRALLALALAQPAPPTLQCKGSTLLQQLWRWPPPTSERTEEMQLREHRVVHIVCTPMHIVCTPVHISLHGTSDLDFRRLRCIMQLTPSLTLQRSLQHLERCNADTYCAQELSKNLIHKETQSMSLVSTLKD